MQHIDEPSIRPEREDIVRKTITALKENYGFSGAMAAFSDGHEALLVLRNDGPEVYTTLLTLFLRDLLDEYGVNGFFAIQSMVTQAIAHTTHPQASELHAMVEDARTIANAIGTLERK